MVDDIIKIIKAIKCKMRCCCVVKSDCVGEGQNEGNNEE